MKNNKMNKTSTEFKIKIFLLVYLSSYAIRYFFHSRQLT